VGRATREKKPISKTFPAKKKTTKKTRKTDATRKKVVKKAINKTTVTPVKNETTTAKPAVKKNMRNKKFVSPKNSNLLAGPVRGFKPYKQKRGEAYMNDRQLNHFRQILTAWKDELMAEVDRTVLHMKDDASNFPDPNDRATQESEFGLELRTRDRERKLLRKINSALLRVENESYGYCDETGDEIGLGRLEARPVATLCVEAQERRELAERQFSDRRDGY
jgi:DnaK suppressor protein|tara:strand:- start:9 stop:671 length:663 start_codon:yes stop_codon:yes gene_type:complete